MLHCEHAMGGGWMYAPLRWATDDGCVPFKVVWVYFRAIELFHAREALNTSKGINLAFGENAALQTAHEDAYPESAE